MGDISRKCAAVNASMSKWVNNSFSSGSRSKREGRSFELGVNGVGDDPELCCVGGGRIGGVPEDRRWGMGGMKIRVAEAEIAGGWHRDRLRNWKVLAGAGNGWGDGADGFPRTVVGSGSR